MIKPKKQTSKHQIKTDVRGGATLVADTPNYGNTLRVM